MIGHTQNRGGYRQGDVADRGFVARLDKAGFAVIGETALLCFSRVLDTDD